MNEATGKTRVMVVDDSALVRGLWARLIDREGDMHVVASAWHGQAALDILRRKQVDVVLLDIEMPEMDGLTALPLILELKPEARVIMVSTLTQKGAEVTIQALSLGAVDFVAKPQAASGGLEAFRKVIFAPAPALTTVVRLGSFWARTMELPRSVQTTSTSPALMLANRVCVSGMMRNTIWSRFTLSLFQ